MGFSLKLVRELSCKEHGLALTEYLLLLGLVIGGVTFAIGTFSSAVGTSWRAWAGVYEAVSAAAGTQSAGSTPAGAQSGGSTPAGTQSGGSTPTETHGDRRTLPCQNGIDQGNAERSRCGGR